MTTSVETESTPDIKFPFGASTVEAFTKGDCWVLTQSLNAQCKEMAPVTISSTCRRWWCHVGNRMKDGRIVDIEGVWEEEAWLAHWTPYVYEHHDTEIMVLDWTTQEFADEIDGARGYTFSPKFPVFSKNVETYADAVIAMMNDKKSFMDRLKKFFGI